MVEEADETAFWLEMMEELQIVKEKENLKKLRTEAEEILKTTAAYKKKLGESM